MTMPSHLSLRNKSSFLYCKGSIPLRVKRYKGCVKGNLSVCLLCLECLHVYAFWCVCYCVDVSVCAHTCTPTLTLRLWLVQASATSVHHHRYGSWLDSRSGGAQDILSTLSCLLIMISFDGFPISYRRHSAHTHTHTLSSSHMHTSVHTLTHVH